MAVQICDALSMGLLCGIAGLIIGLIAIRSAIGNSYDLLPISAFIAAFLTGSTLWWILITRRRAYTVIKGISAGIITSIASHYVCWYLVILGNNFCYWV